MLADVQMIYFVLVALALGIVKAQNGAVLEMTGDAAKIEFGGALTLIHNTTEDQLTCSGKIQASDVLIEGTSTTVADLIGEVATLRQEMAAVKAFVGMMPPPASPPASPPSPPLPLCEDICSAWNGYPRGVNWEPSTTVCAHCLPPGSTGVSSPSDGSSPRCCAGTKTAGYGVAACCLSPTGSYFS